MRYDSDSPTLYREIGERIMLARRRAGLSQRKFGERLGVTHAAVSDIERAKTKPNLDNLAQIADALGVPLGEIVVLERRRPKVTDHKFRPANISGEDMCTYSWRVESERTYCLRPAAEHEPCRPSQRGDVAAAGDAEGKR